MRKRCAKNDNNNNMAGGELSSCGPVLLAMLSMFNARQELIFRRLRETENRIRHIKRSVKKKMEAELVRSREKFEEDKRAARRRYRRQRQAAFTMFVQRQLCAEGRKWTHERPRGKAFWFNVLHNFDDDQWREHFRMSRGTFEYLVHILEPKLTRRPTNWRKALEPRQRLAIVLWWFATPSDYRTVGCLFGVGTSTVFLLVRQVTYALKRILLKRVIRLPEGERLQNTLEGFSARGSPMCAGVIGGTRLPVISPRRKHGTSHTHKQRQCIVMQAVVDHNSLFTDVYVGRPGRTRCDRVLANSPLYKTAEEQDGCLFPSEKSGSVTGEEIPAHLIGGRAYPLKTWLMRGFSDPQCITPERRAFNRRLASVHSVLEKAFARLKGRWRCLLKRNDVSVTLMPDIAVACCILHNVCERNNETFLPQWNTGLCDNHNHNQQGPDPGNGYHGEAEAIRQAVMSAL